MQMVAGWNAVGCSASEWNRCSAAKVYPLSDAGDTALRTRCSAKD